MIQLTHEGHNFVDVVIVLKSHQFVIVAIAVIVRILKIFGYPISVQTAKIITIAAKLFSVCSTSTVIIVILCKSKTLKSLSPRQITY